MAGSKKHVLVIEDDDSVRSLLYRALSIAYEVELIADGSDAIVRVQKEPIADLIICDIMLPGADGLSIARRAKSSVWASVPIIFLTARTTPRDVIQGIQAGARNYVTKPFKIKELLDRVQKIVGT